MLWQSLGNKSLLKKWKRQCLLGKMKAWLLTTLNPWSELHTKLSPVGDNPPFFNFFKNFVYPFLISQLFMNYLRIINTIIKEYSISFVSNPIFCTFTPIFQQFVNMIENQFSTYIKTFCCRFRERIHASRFSVILTIKGNYFKTLMSSYSITKWSS